MEPIKNKFFLSSIFALLYILSANKLLSENISSYSLSYNVLAHNDNELASAIIIPFSKNDFYHFKEALAFKESRGRYTVVNKYGYLGKYQFGKKTLERFKIYNTKNFLTNPELQEKAFVALCQVNKWILRKDIIRFVGKKINGIIVTESGILAAAHLAGAGNVKKFLRSNGSTSFSDAFGTSIENYMFKFGGYDTSSIKKDRMPVIS